jgi:hypothetical protein
VAELDQAREAVLVVGVPGDEHVAQPVRDAARLELGGKAQRADLAQARQPRILLRVEVLDAEQHHVCVRQHHVPVRVLGALAGGVQAGGQPQRVRLLEDSRRERGLQQRLATGARDAAAAGAQVGRDAALGLC